MEIIIIIAVIGLAIFLFSNKTSVKDKTIVRQTKKIDTPDGEITVERTTVIDNNKTNFHIPNASNLPSAAFLYNSVQNDTQTKNINQQSNTLPNDNNHFLLTSKVCSNCNQTLSIDNFYQSKKYDDGYSKWCKHCLEEANKVRAEKAVNSKYKVCPHCKKRRLKTSFYKNSNRPDGLTKWCKDCMKG